ncbi:uncharacterized protein LOC118644515 isoform X2 [Monomorium pharaonis]|uniref:uncharacterized protein LOC118644515 isoform X2 n=1 Tax=Monomorium pharaonis TaxID=307658 RepID=UPI0017465342|nr:uncharacterized protein LOC118644515 isoform X2 [Monomorium pharaonis]
MNFSRMNYYVPIQQNNVCDKPTLSQPRYIPRILGRRYALTATAYKYLDIGIRVESMPCVELLIGDNRSRIGHLHLTYAIWKTFIERRADIVQFMQAAVPSSKILIHDLVIDLNWKIVLNKYAINCIKIFILLVKNINNLLLFYVKIMSLIKVML